MTSTIPTTYFKIVSKNDTTLTSPGLLINNSDYFIFSSAKHILREMHFGCILWKLTIPIDDPDFDINPESKTKWKANKIILEESYNIFDTEIISLLMQYGATSSDLLISSSYGGHVLFVISLINKFGNEQIDEALKHASMRGHDIIVKYLVDNGANPSANNNCAFRHAIYHNRLSIVKYMVENGVEIDANNGHAICLATQRENWSVVKYLIKNKADVKVDNNFVFKRAIINNHCKIVDLLVEAGTNIHIKNNWAFKYCVIHIRIQMLRHLVKHGMNCRIDGDFALTHALSYKKIKLLDFLFKNGISIHHNKDFTFKHAIKTGDIKLIKFLTKRGVDIHMEDDIICYIASKNKDYDLLKYLFSEFKFDDDSMAIYFTVERAIKNGSLELLQHMLKCGMKFVDNKDLVVKFAIMNGDLEVLKAILSIKKNNTNFKSILEDMLYLVLNERDSEMMKKYTNIHNYLKSLYTK